MPELDHLVFASPDLDAGCAHLASLVGVTPVAGGPHPGMGTRNALLGMDDSTYFEIIAIDPDQAEPAGPRPFGLDHAAPLTLVGFAIHPTGSETLEDVAALLTGSGLGLGPVMAMSRVKPDGQELHWELAFPSGAKGNAGGAMPFVIDWGDTPSPALGLPSMGTLAELTVSHPDPDVRSAVEGLLLGDHIRTSDGPAGLSARFASNSGSVELGRGI